jgi:hypothetical protein
VSAAFDAQAGAEKRQQDDFDVNQFVQPGDRRAKNIPHDNLEKNGQSHLQHHQTQHIFFEEVQQPY